MRIPLFTRIPRLLAVTALCYNLCLVCTGDAGPERTERTLALMGTELEITVFAENRAAALAAAEASVEALEAVEARLSTWRSNSELCRFNSCPSGQDFTMSPALQHDLVEARRWWWATAGAFDPAVASLTEAWGLRTGGKRPGEAELRTALTTSGFDKLRFAGTGVTRGPGVRIDEGGFGKGAGLDAALVALRRSEATCAVLNLGGQVALFGSPDPVEIRVAHPKERDNTVLSFTVGEGSVATSGNSERGVLIDGKAISHMIDPRTGLPVRDFGSLTVWAPNAMAADCLSTGLYVLGPEKALQLATGWPGIEVLVLETDSAGLVARFTPGLSGRIHSLITGLRLEPAE